MKKENYLTEEERVLINNFISKIKNELNSPKNNQARLNIKIILNNTQ